MKKRKRNQPNWVLIISGFLLYVGHLFFLFASFQIKSHRQQSMLKILQK